MKAQASVEVRILAAQRMIAHYQQTLILFQSGKAEPQVGELLANKLLLKRKQAQLKSLKAEKVIQDSRRMTLAVANAR